MRRTVYWKRLLIVAVALVAFCGAVFAVHRVQIRSQVVVYRDAAERAEAAIGGDPGRRAEAVALYAKYLKFRPTDEGAYQKYAALLFDQTGGEPEPRAVAQSAAGVEGFLRTFPAHPEERGRLAGLYVKSGRHLNARQHLDMLFAAGGAAKSDPELLALAAECDWVLGKKPEAVKLLDQAIATGKASVAVYKRALELNYEQSRLSTGGDQARTNMGRYEDELAPSADPKDRNNGKRFQNDLAARIAAARFKLFRGFGDPAGADVQYALQYIPGGREDPDVLLAAAEVEIAKIRKPEDAPPKLAAAAQLLQDARGRAPTNVAVGALLSDVLVRQGKRDEGVAVLRDTAKLLTAVDSDYALLADRLLDLGEQVQSAAMIAAVAADPARGALSGYFRGRLAVVKQDWMAAARLLEEAGPNVARVPTFYKKAMVGLAACYAAMQNPDKQLEFCRKARAVDPGFPPAVVGEAEALARMGKVRDALREYRILVNQFQMTAYRVELARLELLAALTGPAPGDEASWERFDEAVGVKKGDGKEKRADVQAKLPGDLQVLYADALAARGRGAEAAAGLRGWLNANPKDPKAGAGFVALARLSGGGTAESALAVLDEAKGKVGDSVDLRLARASLVAARGRVPDPAELEALAVGASGFSPPDQFRLWLGLGQTAGRAADVQPGGVAAAALRAAALKYLRTAADLQPTDLTSRGALLDHGLAAGRAEVVARAREEMAAVEGPRGPVGTLGYIAARLPQVEKMTDTAARAAEMKELRELARVVRDARPGWGRVYVALAELDYLDGRYDDALANCTEALDKGERQEFVIRRAVDLYRAKKQDDKAVGLLNKLRTEVRLPDDLERYRAIRDMLSAAQLPANARATVDGIAPADSTDYRLQLLRGALLATLRDEPAAAAAYRRAVELNDRSVETWASLVVQLARAGQPDEAGRAAAAAEKALLASPPASAEGRAELSVALAGMREAAGDPATALARYEAAAAAAPVSLNAVRQLILFHQRTGAAAKADQLLTAAAESPAADVARWARRHRALTLVTGPTAYNMRGPALELIERNLRAAPDDTEDRKARAVVLTVDPVTRDEGIKLLRERGELGDLTPDEYYLLGRLAFDVGRLEEAEGHFRLAARVRPGVTAEHLAALVRVYAALNRPDLAAGALERLKANNPGSWEATREEARLLARQSREKAAAGEADAAKKVLAQAAAVVKAFPGWDAADGTTSRTGALLEEIGLTADAEALYGKFLAASKDPGAYQPLAILFIRQKQVQKAIDLAFEHEPKAPPLLTARVLTGAVRAARPAPAVEARIGAWLDAALAKAAADPELEASLIGAKAELADARAPNADPEKAKKQYDVAIGEYERAIAAFGKVRNPRGNNDFVVNNLCMLLALNRPERANDAVRMMSELIAVRGPVPSFLDTRAVAYLVSSRPKEAIKDLELALAQYERGTYRFHLAWAFDLNPLEPERVRAVDELKKARRLGLTADDLHPIEFSKYNALLAKYKLPPEGKP